MADTPISGLTAASALAGADTYAIVQSGATKKATHNQLMTAILLLLGDSDGTLAANSATKIAVQSAVKTYVDAKLAGLSWKQAVRAATTTNGTLASAFANGSTIDGVTLATGDRILLKNQSTASDNGIYIVAASGAPTRATDADSGAELVNASVYVSEGTANADTQWTCTTNATITVGATSLAFAQLTSGGGDASTNTSTSVDSEVALFSSTAGKTLKRATGTGFAKLTSGVLSATSTNTTRADLGEKVSALTDGATISVDASLANNFRVTLGGNRTLANPTNLIDGQVLNFRILQDGTGSRTLAYGTKYKFAGGVAPVLSTAAASKDFMSCQYDSTDDTLNCSLLKAFA